MPQRAHLGKTGARALTAHLGEHSQTARIHLDSDRQWRDALTIGVRHNPVSLNAHRGGAMHDNTGVTQVRTCKNARVDAQKREATEGAHEHHVDKAVVK